MRAGRFDHRIELQEQTNAQDALGGFTKTWTTTVTVWAGIDQVGGRENIKHGQRFQDASARMLIRYQTAIASIDNTWRAVDARTGRKWDIITAFTPDMGRRWRNRTIELIVKENESDDE